MIFETFKRFKLAFLFYVLACVSSIWLVITNRTSTFCFNEPSILPLLFTLGTISTVLSFYLEVNNKKISKIELLSFLACTLCAVSFFYFTPTLVAYISAIPIQLSLLCIGIGLSKSSNDFGYYVITRLFVLGLCLLIVCVGVTFLDHQITLLFGKEFLEEFRKYLCPIVIKTSIYGIFPIIFLSLIPKEEKSYPNLFSKFVNYLALPLFVISFIELCLYSFKACNLFASMNDFTWSGWCLLNIKSFMNIDTVRFLVFLCIISFLLIAFFIRNLNRYTYCSILIALQLFFYFFVGPKVIDEFNNHGFNEFAYFFVALGAVLLASTFYKKKYIINIVGICGLITFFSPINVDTVSTFFQINRLENLLIQEKILIDEKIKPVIFSMKNNKQPEIHHEIKRIIRYLCNKECFEFMKPWFVDLKDAEIHKYLYQRSFFKTNTIFPKEVGNHSMYDLAYKTLQDIRLEPKSDKKNRNPL